MPDIYVAAPEVGDIYPSDVQGSIFKSAEEIDCECVQIQGRLPAYVKGSFIRNGPGKWDLGSSGSFVMNSFLDGYSILSKFDIAGDSIKFTKKYLQSDAYRKATSHKRPIYFEFATRSYPDPSKNFLSRFVPSIIPELSDNVNISLVNIGDKLVAFGEGCHFRELTSNHLDCGKKFDSKAVFSQNVITPHPLIDHDGTVWNIGSSMLNGLKFNVIKTPPAANNSETLSETLKRSTTICSIPSRHLTCMSYSHSFGITDNYIIFIEQPLVLNVTKILGSALNKGNTCLQSWLEWHKTVKNKFHIIEKSTGKHSEVDIISDKPFFFLHFINCFELDKNQIIIDLMTFPNASVFDSMHLGNLRKGITNSDDPQVNPTGQRFAIPILFTNKELSKIPEGFEVRQPNATEGRMVKRDGHIIVYPENITKRGAELPAINRRFQGRKIDYYYMSGTLAKGAYANSVCKVNPNTKQVTLWKESEFHVMGEPIFIPDPEGVNEDDGILVFAVTDQRPEHKDFVIFLDARNMKEVARAEFQASIPLALHGIFLNK